MTKQEDSLKRCVCGGVMQKEEIRYTNPLFLHACQHAYLGMWWPSQFVYITQYRCQSCGAVAKS